MKLVTIQFSAFSYYILSLSPTILQCQLCMRACIYGYMNLILIYVVYVENYCDRENSIVLEILTDLHVLNASPFLLNVRKCFNTLCQSVCTHVCVDGCARRERLNCRTNSVRIRCLKSVPL
jgi:ferredoxin